MYIDTYRHACIHMHTQYRSALFQKQITKLHTYIHTYIHTYTAYNSAFSHGKQRVIYLRAYMPKHAHATTTSSSQERFHSWRNKELRSIHTFKRKKKRIKQQYRSAFSRGRAVGTRVYIHTNVQTHTHNYTGVYIHTNVQTHTTTTQECFLAWTSGALASQQQARHSRSKQTALASTSSKGTQQRSTNGCVTLAAQRSGAR